MNKSTRALDVIVIGGGQAGLAVGWHLQQHGLDFLILDEQTHPGGNWRNYYDSLRIPRHPATQSALIWPGIPRPSGHLFHGHPAGQSERSDAGGA
ncbi:FAD-dependent oxidoreductase, partial [Pseudomonas sp. ABFPK]|uniref:FAD-dependent oxidoreductase n=1 Tax=Pseudomonas sp. ABFPK TaxID=1636605 RepID=UPI000A9126F3